MHNIQTFFYMSGYGGYVFSAYGLVFILLLWEWFKPWKKWQRYKKVMQSTPHAHE
ncbi:MAG: heme exporter protein CcmD [Gammaproteobacteria bacterium]|nr:heme exporter protein CcmD [Gammaproteobacteria bacterium]